MPILQPVRCPCAGVFQKGCWRCGGVGLGSSSWKMHCCEDGWKCALGRGFSVPKEGASEGAGAVCHPHQGRDTLKGWQPVWATCAGAGTPLIDWNPWRTDAGAEEKHQEVKSSREKLLHAAPVSWDGSRITCHTHRESWDEMQGKDVWFRISMGEMKEEYLFKWLFPSFPNTQISDQKLVLTINKLCKNFPSWESFVHENPW